MRSEHVTLIQGREPVHAIILSGEIIFNGGISTLDCLIRSLTDDGAHLDMSNTVGVPGWFTLKIEQDERWLPARVTRRDDKSIDIEFDDTNERRLCGLKMPSPHCPEACRNSFEATES